MDVLRITSHDFALLSVKDEPFHADSAYEIVDSYTGNVLSYAYSPDGIGTYWYVTLEEMENEHA